MVFEYGTITDDLRDRLRKKIVPQWATIIPSRSTAPAIKLHATGAHARNAISGTQATGGRGRFPYDRDRGGYPVAEAELYRFVGGKWRLEARIENGTYPNDLPWKREK